MSAIWRAIQWAISVEVKEEQHKRNKKREVIINAEGDSHDSLRRREEALYRLWFELHKNKDR